MGELAGARYPSALPASYPLVQNTFMSDTYIGGQHIYNTVHNIRAEGSRTYTKLNVKMVLWKTQQRATVTNCRLLVT